MKNGFRCCIGSFSLVLEPRYLIILSVFFYLVLDWALTDNHAIDALTDWLNWVNRFSI